MIARMLMMCANAGGSIPPSGSNVYTINGSNISIFDRNTSTGALSGSTLETLPHTSGRNIKISPDGLNVYAIVFGRMTWYDRNILTGAITFVNYVSGVTYFNPFDLTISSDGKNIYATNGNSYSNTLSIYDRNVSTGALSGTTSTMPTGTTPVGVAISNDGYNVYVTNQDDNTVTVFTRLPIDGSLVLGWSGSGATSTIGTGNTPLGIAISSDDASVYVANSSDNTVTIFVRNLATGQLSTTSTIATGTFPFGVAISNDGYNVYVTNVNSNTVSIFTRNISTGALSGTSTIATGTLPQYITISSDDANVYVSNYNSNNVSIFDRNLSTGALSGTTVIATGTTPQGIAVYP